MLNQEFLTSNRFADLTRTGNELNSTLHKSQLINLILARGAELPGRAGICLVLFHGKGETPESYPHGLSEEFAQRIPSFSKDPVSKAVSKGEVQHFDDLPGSREEGIASILCLPLIHNEEMRGLLYFFYFEEPSLPENHIQELQIFSNFAATAIENALLYEMKERKIRQLNILNEATVSLSSEPDMETLFQKLADHALFLLRSKGALLILLSSDSNRINQTYLSGDLERESLQFQPLVAGPLYEIMKTHTVLNLQAAELEGEGIDLPFSLPDLRNLLAVPIFHQKTSIGILLLLNNVPFDNEDEDLLLTYGFQTALSIENAQLHEHTKKLSVTDGLTGLFNHREFQNGLAAEIRRCIRYKRVFSLLMIDIDHFKTFNDTYGHPAGDKVLQKVARAIQESIRDIDIPARYGGEEFVVILPETTYEHAYIVAERIRGNIFEQSTGKSLDNKEISITVSIGVSTFPDDALSSEELITKCDQALYFAKREGRNRVRRYDETLKAVIEKQEDQIEEILKDAELNVMQDLAAAVDAKNLFTRGHTEQVVKYSVGLAKALQLSSTEIESIKLASILHDIGTVSVPETILNKPGPLTSEEKRIIQGHPALGEIILKKVSQLESIIPTILNHHERYDGQGYPHGLKGEEIPLMARIIGLVEAYQAMISDRPYRQRLSKEKAIKELRENAGKQFDPGIVETFIKVIS